MSELLPCPFCGGEKARTIHIRDGRKVVCICGACGKPEFHGPLDQPDAETRAIAAWNTRPADHAGLVDAMERAALIVDRYLYRQSEKVEDVPRILRAALTALRNPKP